jgi:two-component system response regulator RegX3
MTPHSLRALVASGDATLRRALVRGFEAAGHRVDAADDGDAAVRLGAAVEHDVILLDASIPRGDGFEVCRVLRKLRPAAPVVMLVGAAAEVVRLREPGAGADAWVSKPVAPADLLHRVEALRRRLAASRSTPDLLVADGVRLELARCAAFRSGSTVPLTAREVAILRWLYNHRTRAVSRAELLEEVWGVPGDLQTRTVDMTVANLRRKIEAQTASPRIIVTVKGFGYVWGAGERA